MEARRSQPTPSDLGRKLARRSDARKHMFERPLTSNSRSPMMPVVEGAQIRRRRAACALAVGVALVLGWSSAAAHGADRPPDDGRPAAQTSLTYVVEPGDTLWSVARQVAPDRDPREVVEAIARTNGMLDVRLVAGQSLQIPPGIA